MIEKYKNTYENRWRKSSIENDDDILVFKNPENISQFFYLNYNKIIDSIIDKKDNNEILEIGCGRGTASLYLKILNPSFKFDLMDFSENAIKIAKKNFQALKKDATFINSDIYKFKPKKNYDLIISLGVLEHIEDLDGIIKRMKSMLKKNGMMVHMIVPEKKSVQNYFNWFNKLFSQFSKKKKKEWLDKETYSKTSDVYRSYKTSKEFLEKFTHHGFFHSYKIEVNPFPTITNAPLYFEKMIVKIFKIILVFKKYLFFKKRPFECSENLSRAHFIIAKK